MVNVRNGKALAPTTFAARMRDAIVSLQRFGWETYISTDKFVQIFGQFQIVAGDDGSVWFRNRLRRGRPLSLVDANEKGAIHPGPNGLALVSHWRGWTLAHVEAAAVLIHHGWATGHVQLEGEVPPNEIARLTSMYNIGLFFDPAQNKTILS
jgi:hypothetical protein